MSQLCSLEVESQASDTMTDNELSLVECEIPIQPCIRHISTIQIRNLSPSPTRDSIAAALSQPSEFSSSIPGKGNDDTDLLTRRRKRRTSTASSHTLGSEHSEYDYERDLIQGRRSPKTRPRTSSKTSVRTSSSNERRYTQGNVQSLPSRNRQRPETIMQELPEGADVFRTSTFAQGSLWPTDSISSQKDLEDVIWSRLIESFITIHIPGHDFQSEFSLVNAPETAMHPKKAGIPFRTRAQHTRQSNSMSTPALERIKNRPTHSSRASSDASVHCSTPSTLGFPRSPPLTPPPTLHSEGSSVPAFISPIQRPSTNPKFIIEPVNESFAKWADLSSKEVSVQLWGRTTSEWNSMRDSSDAKGKGKMRIHESNLEVSGDWQLLDEWELDLTELTPLPDDLSFNYWKLPANTIILTLSASSQLYYFPSTLVYSGPIASRSQTPEYSSDSELPLRRNVNLATSSPRRTGPRNAHKDSKTTNFNELLKLVSLQASLADAQNLLDEVIENCDHLIEKDNNIVLQREASEREYRLQCLQEQHDALDDYMKIARDQLATRKEDIRQRRIRLAEARALHEDDLLTEIDAGVRLADERKNIHAIKRQIEPVQTSLLSTLSFIFPIDLLSPPDLLYTILDVPLPIPMNGTDPAPPLTLSHVNAVSEDGVATALGYAALVVQLMAAYLCQLLVYPITYVGSRSLIKDPISAMMGPRMFPLYSKGVDTYRFEYAVFLLNKNIEMLMADRNLRALDLRHTLPNLKNLLLTLTSGEVAVKPRSRPLPSPSVDSITAALQTPDTRPQPESGDVRTPEVPLLVLDDSSTTPKVERSSLPIVEDKSVKDNSNEEYPAGDGTSHSIVSSGTDNLGSSGSDLGTVSSSSSVSGAGGSTIRPRLPRLPIQSYLGLAPLASMWRGRSSSSSTNGTTKSEQLDSSQTSTSSSTTSDLSEPDGRETISTAPTSEFSEGSQESQVNGEEAGNDEGDEDEDDRCTVRGASAPTTPTTEARPSEGSNGGSVLDNLKAHIRGSTASNNVSTNGKLATSPSETLSKSNEGTDPSFEKIRTVVV